MNIWYGLIQPVRLFGMMVRHRPQLVYTNLAQNLGVATVILYGPTWPSFKIPGQRNRALQAQGVPCLGCNLNRCPFGHECMSRLTPETVIDACREVLQ